MTCSKSPTGARKRRRKSLMLKKLGALGAALSLAGMGATAVVAPAAAAPGDLKIEEINFGELPTGATKEYTFTLTNTSTTDAQDISALSFVSMGESQLSVIDDQCAPVQGLAPGETCEIKVSFHPTVIENSYVHGISADLDGTYIPGYLRGKTFASLEAKDGLDLDFGEVPVGD